MAYILNKAATGTCSHGGSASPTAGIPRVKLGGTEVLTVATQFTVSGCSNMLGQSPFPCVIGIVPVGATRVKVMGVPVLLDSGKPQNVPTGVATTIINTQMRVKGQ